MEVNGRFWGALQLAIDAALDFPYAFYRITCGEPVDVPSDYAVASEAAGSSATCCTWRA